ncbi:DNA-directed RNA polymerase subunit beta' [Candidatus Woesebacteria bacterium]|nr:DNA-directed RNA polymerase subunit beta' [Candidatus Woesebacteria bacterium]
MKSVVDFSALGIRIASPEVIKSWSHGEIKKPETINYRSLRAEKDGLFDEKIFGPTKDYECFCGKYKRIRYKGIICDKCGVEVTQAKVRRERMGHITLSAPVAHIWYFRGAPSQLSLLLDISPRNINSIIYFSKYVVLDVDADQKVANYERLDVDVIAAKDELRSGVEATILKLKEQFDLETAALKEKVTNKETLQLKLVELELRIKNKMASLKQQLETQVAQTDEIFAAVKNMVKRVNTRSILTEDEYLKLDEYDVASHLRVGMGAESLLELVKLIDMDGLVESLRAEMDSSKGPKRIKAIKRLRVVEGLYKAQISPAWTFLTILPVIPPDLRPMVQLSGGRFATSDLNDLYRRVINRNNRLKHLIDLGAPEIILRNEKRMLQEAVDALIDGSQAVTARRRATRRPLKSLSEMLKGKQGRFRQNLLGKRVDYSGRSVIVVGPELRLDQCGLPKDMALEMFKPYVLRELIVQGVAPNVKSARQQIDRREPVVYDILEKVTENHPVILNRAPTLHKLGMQAFFPILIEGNAIRLHPCVCAGYNADFDGDQMAVHIPLTNQAQEEAKVLMLASHNLLKPANGEPITVPNKEMALGVFYLTSINTTVKPFTHTFASTDEAFHAFQIGQISRRQQISVRFEGTVIDVTIGRLQFNQVLEGSFAFLNETVTAKRIKQIVTEAISILPQDDVALLIDAVKNLGFAAATESGLSVSVTDCEMIEEKVEIIERANRQVEEIQIQFQDGFISAEERKRLSFDVWMKTTDEVAEKTWDSYDENNAVKVMINSGGTRASKDQVKQLAAMRGLVVDPLGNIVEMPTKSNFRQGLSIFEYVTSARGSRKGLTDSAIKTADAGYLTRRLVDVAHDMIVRMYDCGTIQGVAIPTATRPDIFSLRISGRYASEDVEVKGKTIIKKGALITPADAEAAQKAGVESVSIFSPLSCESPKGLCAKCYGLDFATHREVEIGVPVGIIAAQSIGEPGTQLTMRVKHSGGIVGLDVTQGLPRVEELFEARTPRNAAVLSEVSGKVSISEEDGRLKATITNESTGDEETSYWLPLKAELLVSDGDMIHPGMQLTGGSLNLREVLQLKGLLFLQQYLIDQVQAVYESQGIQINDKHFETIVRKMSDKVQLESTGETEFLMGEVIERSKFRESNDDVVAAGGQPATAKVLFLGITRSALFTSSWLSAASFQHTKHVLTEAASRGDVDHLEGLKENVIIGRLIPTSPERALLVA